MIISKSLWFSFQLLEKKFFFSKIILNLLPPYDFWNLDHSKQVNYRSTNFKTTGKQTTKSPWFLVRILPGWTDTNNF